MNIDPRTQISIMLLVAILAFTIQTEEQFLLLMVATLLYLLVNKRGKAAIYFIFFYATGKVLLISIPFSINALFILLYTFIKVLPLMMIGYVFIHTSPSKILYSLEKFNVPKSILIIVTILIRFYPVILTEVRTIREGIRVRGIFSNVWDAIRHPVVLYECFFVPLIIRCLKLSTELGASAELRGIEVERKRTTIYETKLGVADVLSLLFFLSIGGAVYMMKGIF